MMTQKKWKIIEDFVLNEGRFNSDDFEEYLEIIGLGVERYGRKE